MKTYIVIGIGILGASTSYHLAKAGAKVIMIDRKDLGQATDAAAGIICPWLTQRRNKAWYFLAKHGARYYPKLIQELEHAGEVNTGYKQVGAISLHADDQKLDKLEERALSRLEHAPEIGRITRLSAAETKRYFPPLADELGGIHISGGARVNGRELRDALISASMKLGAVFIHGDAQITEHTQETIGIKVNNQLIKGDYLIVTAGAWSADLLKPLGFNLKVKPQKAQIIHLEYRDHTTQEWPVIMPPNNQYILAFPNGRIVIGATHEDEMGFDSRVTAGGMQEILSKALQIAPGLASSTVKETRVGFRPVLPDFLPVIGTLPTNQNILLANGLGASGLTVGPYMGGELAKLALGRDLEIDLSHYEINNVLEEI